MKKAYNGWPLWFPLVNVVSIITELHGSWSLLMQDIDNNKHEMASSF